MNQNILDEDYEESEKQVDALVKTVADTKQSLAQYTIKLAAKKKKQADSGVLTEDQWQNQMGWVLA